MADRSRGSAEAPHTTSLDGGARVKRWTIGVMSDTLDWPYANALLLGIRETLREHAATIVMFNGGVLLSSQTVDWERNAVFDLIDPDRIDGLIVLAQVGNSVGQEGLSAYCWRYARMPLCSLATELPGRPSVVVDNTGGMSELVEHMVVKHGKRRIAFVRGPEGSPEGEQRYQAYRKVLERHSIELDPSLVAQGDLRSRSAVDALRVLLDERQVHFDALIAANDDMALSAMEALQARGVHVPGDVAVAGFGDVEEGRFSAPPLTSVRQPVYESGRQAARLLVAMLRKEIGPARITLPTKVVVRESCGCSDDGLAHRSPAPFGKASSLAQHFAERRLFLLQALRRALPLPRARISPSWVEPLFDAFLEDVREGHGGLFIELLVVTLRRVAAAGGSLRLWHACISLLWSEAVTVTGDPEGLRRASWLLHRARVLVGDLREQVQAQHRIQRAQLTRRLYETSEVLTKSFGAASLVEAIARELPRWHIPSCAVAVYDEEGRRPLTRARPLFVYDDGQRVPSDAAKAFPACELAPGGWLDARPRTLVAQPLSFRGQQLGFALFEMGPKEGEVYEGLRTLLSSAIKGMRLVEHVVEAATSRQRAERERLEKEMEIATRIQTSLVFKSVVVPGLEIAATMIPATEVGGDYYDIVPYDAGCWVGIGDVAGHGLQTGLVMLIIQSVVSALVRDNPRASPREAVRILNSVMFESVRLRMGQDEHATLLLLRYENDGLVTYAGAHEEVIVYRAAERRCERLEILGPVLGAVRDVGATIAQGTFRLNSGDIMVLYTDGLIDAMDAHGVTFGVERLCAELESVAGTSVKTIRDHLVTTARAWAETHRDDVSLVVVRHT
jgi:DNA-binding LacI/PurR family transcriptional regulator/serine phosphatase RsbU (regulator of sigma subunit)